MFKIKSVQFKIKSVQFKVKMVYIRLVHIYFGQKAREGVESCRVGTARVLRQEQSRLSLNIYRPS